jgi:hypothetical protein
MVVLRTEMWGLSSLVPGVCVAALLEPVLYFFLAVEITPNQSDDTLHPTFLVNTHVVEKHDFLIRTYSNRFDMAVPF